MTGVQTCALPISQNTLPEMILGVGSVTDAEAASHYMKIGANFVITRSEERRVGKECRSRW